MKCSYCNDERTAIHLCEGLKRAAGLSTSASRSGGGLGDLPPDYGRFISTQRVSKAGPMPGDLSPWFYFGSDNVAAAATSTFVFSNQSVDSEALLLGFQYYIDSEDYQTSPVSVVITGTNSGAVAKSVFDPIRGPVGRGTGASAWFWFPEPYGIYVKRDQIVGLQVKNNEAVTQYVEGRIFGVSWPSSQRPRILEDILGSGK